VEKVDLSKKPATRKEKKVTPSNLMNEKRRKVVLRLGGLVEKKVGKRNR